LEQNTFSKILMGFAFSPKIRPNILEALRISYYLETSLVLFHVGKKTPSKEEIIKNILKESNYKPKNIVIKWEEGNPVKVLLEASKKMEVDMLLLGALQRENVLKFYLGSIARKITRKATCSVFLLINPSEERKTMEHIVVNGIKSSQTEKTIFSAFEIAFFLKAKKITVVEEISQSEVAIAIEDEKSLKKATLKQEKLDRRETARVADILKKIPKKIKEEKQIKTQSIFGKRGYSIGHYAKIMHADLLVTNASFQRPILRWFLIRDLEYILQELPTNVLIVRPKEHIK